MSIKAVLFDLDGTLLPMDQNVFVKAYFKELVGIIAPMGYAPDDIVSAVWAGTHAMVKNDGKYSNKTVFWDVMAKTLNTDVKVMIEKTDAFYLNEFERVRQVVGENPKAIEAVRAARKGGKKVVLSTNPIFPLTAQKKRLSWIGLSGDEFDLITSYESDSYCKPNPQYFLEICKRIGVAPEECLVIGNDEREDMFAATKAGMKAYLITDCVIRQEGFSWQGESGNFEEMIKMLSCKEF